MIQQPLQTIQQSELNYLYNHMKLLKSILSLILLLPLAVCITVLSLVSCKEASDRKPNATGTSYATLIAYSIHGKHKHSDAT